MRIEKNLPLFLLLCIFITGLQPVYGMEIEGKLYHILNLSPGEGKVIEISVRNSSDKPEHIQVYQTDYLFSADGKNIFGKPGSVERSNASWIKISPNRLSIPPGGRESFSVQIKVLSQNSLDGTYWSLVHVDKIPSGSLEPPGGEVKSDHMNLNVQAMTGYGIQVITHVGTPEAGKIEMEEPSLTVEDKEYIFSLNMECQSDFMANPTTWLELFDSTGSRVDRVDARNYFIYPGCSMRVHYLLGQLEKGEYKALVIADCGYEQVYGAQYELQVR